MLSNKKCTNVENKIIQIGLRIVLSFFLVISVAFISPIQESPKTIYRSSDLQKIITTADNVVRTEYVNEEGKITIAANLGYAIKIVTTTEKGELESFYDELGNPVVRYSSYYQIFREYDPNGNNTRITYLDDVGRPVLYEGYAIEERSFNENTQITEVKYYDTEGNQVFTKLYGCGKINEYDDYGNNSKTTFVDKNKKPVVTGIGYACVVRTFYRTENSSNGKVDCEFYYDESGNPIARSLGQYGVHFEYDENGRTSILTYLDKKGELIVTNKGYTTIKRQYNADDTIFSEMYYDINGNSYSLAEGQYGVKNENGQTQYLDKNGKELFNVRNLLNNSSWIVIIISLALVVVSASIEKKLNLILLVFYIGVIFYMTLMFRENADSEVRLIPFWKYSKFFTNSKIRAEIIKNIWLFIPFGAILYQVYHKKTVLLVPFLLAVGIELLQFFTGTGFCELNDIIHNSLGGIIGYRMGKLTKQKWMRDTKK